MATRETSLWRWLAKSRLVYRELLHLSRVENSVAEGTPDVEGCLTAASPFWIELKIAAVLRGDKVRMKHIRPAQVEWLRRRCAVGGLAWILVQVGSGRTALRFLIWGTHADELSEGVVSLERLRHLAVVDSRSRASEIIDAASQIVEASNGP